MSREPRFDELFPDEPDGAERDSLRRTHELLVQAGPPPDVPPELEKAPVPPALVFPTPKRTGRRVALLIAAAVTVAAIFGVGFGVGRGGRSSSHVLWSLPLQGTRAAPAAHATLAVLAGDSGNWPMTLRVSGLPKLPAHTQYEVYLVRDGKPWASCGTFVTAGTQPVSVTLNAPYALHHGDTWVVTREAAGHEHGPTVLRPA